MFRELGPDGRLAGDVLTLAAERLPGTPLLEPVMRAGRRVAPAPTIAALRAHCGAEVARLPEPLRSLTDADPYPVEIASTLRNLAAEIDAHT